MKLNTEDFLWQSYFGITKTEAQKNCCLQQDDICLALDKCIDRAFLDFARTIDYKYSDSKVKELQKKDPDEALDFIKKKENFKCKQKKEILKGINNIITGDQNAPEEERENYFNKVHEETCNNLCKCHEVLKNNLTYGQAQKWLNMTLKYMVLMDLWEDDFKGVEKFFHIPLDDFILKALFYFPRGGESISKQINVEYRKDYPNKSELINDEDPGYVKGDGTFMIKNGRMLKTNEWGKNKKGMTWSNIKEPDDYKCIQKEVKKHIPEEYKLNPLAWENTVWIYASQIIK